MTKILVTGCAGFIGFHMSKMLCENGYQVVGIDNMNDYYDVQLKKSRVVVLDYYNNFKWSKRDVRELDWLETVFNCDKFDKVIHLAAQAGVRHSMDHPQDYIDNNITGFLNILECCKKYEVKKLLYASSSSVYGHHVDMPFSEDQPCNIPANFYAVTKKCNEGMAYSYNRLYGLDSIGLRFFTVYGPWGRPDMALFLFTKAIIEGKPIDVYNNGDMSRDFTYVDDIVEGIKELLVTVCQNNIFNIGCCRPSQLMTFIAEIETKLGMPAIINKMPMQPGDIKSTYCDTRRLELETGYKPKTTIKEGISKFVDWYLEYYGVKL